MNRTLFAVAVMLLTTRLYASQEIVWASVVSGAIQESESYNPLGTTQVINTSTGNFTVLFGGVQPESGDGSNGYIHAIARDQGFYCHVSGWGIPAASVQCRTAAGTLTNANFQIMQIPANNEKRLVFALAHQPTTASYSPAAPYSWNAGNSITITRITTGVYTVNFAGRDTSGGTLMASTFGNTDAVCRVQDLNGVRCNSPSGSAVDAQFTVGAISGGEFPRAMGFAFKSSTGDVLNASYSYSMNSSPSLTKVTTGAYSVFFPDQYYGATSHNFALATAETPSRFCRARGVGRNGSSAVVAVACYDFNGDLADSTFYVQYFTAARLRNPGFELPYVTSTTTNVSPTGWGLDEGNNAGLRSVVITPSGTSDGKHVLAILNTTVSLYQDVETTPGRIYQLKLRAGHAGTGSQLKLVWGPYSTLVDLEDTLEVYTFDLPATESSTRLRFFATQGTSGTQVQLDAVSLDLLPTTAKCSFSVSPNPMEFNGYGAPRNVTVTNTEGTNCVFGMESLPDWIPYPAQGKRHGTASILLDPAVLSILSGSREGTATIAGKSITLHQQSVCSDGLSMAPIAAAGGAGSVQLPNDSPCTYTLTMQPNDFLTFTGSNSGPGGSAIAVSATPNPGTLSRAASFTVVLSLSGFPSQSVGVGFTVQLGTTCSFILSKLQYNVPAGGSSAIIGVTASASGCPWTVQNPSSFVTIAPPGSGVGSGTFQVNVAANPSSPYRTATLTVGNASLTVNQAGSSNCSVSFSTPNVAVGATQQRVNVTVTNNTSPNCVWNVENIPSFVTFNTMELRAGTRILDFVVQANPAPNSRTATVMVSGSPLTITQDGAGGCVFGLSHSYLFIPAAGDNQIRVNVKYVSGTNCPWTVADPSGFVTLMSVTNGSTYGSATFAIAALPGGMISRSTVLTIAGISLVVYQLSSDCAYSVSPLSTLAPAVGSTGLEINVVQTGGVNWCPWSITNIPPQVTVTSPTSFETSGKVTYNVSANETFGIKGDTMKVAGQFFQLTQAGAAAPPPCQYTVSPTTFNVPSGGSTGLIVNVSTINSCVWTVSNPSSFVSVTSGSGGGTGSGSVSFNVQSNTSTIPRSAQMTIAGQTVTMNEAGATVGSCAFTLSQSGLSIAANGGNGFTVQITNTAGSNCAWSVLNPSSFVIVTTGAQGGTGSGTISFNVLGNTSASARTATLTVAGLFLTVSQAGVTGPAPNTSGLRFVPLEPCRLLETRQEYNYQGRTGAFGPPFFNANDTRTLNLPQSTVCNVPSAAKAYVLNVTVIPRGAGVDYLTVWPAGEARPLYWTVRSPDAQIVANSTIVAAGASGGISVFASNATDIIIDIAGYFTDNASLSNLVFYPLTPCRVVDTRTLYRQGGTAFGPPTLGTRETRSYRVPATPFCNIPEGASAYSVTITVDPNAQPLQFITTWPSGQSMPNVSSINSPAGRILANSVIVPVSSTGSIDVHAFNPSDLILDINGYFAPDDGVNGLYFFTAPQCRISDSSSATYTGAYGPPIYENESVRSISLPGQARCTGLPANARAFALNTTVLPGGSPMPFLTIYPTGQSRPNASVINAFQGQIVSSAAIIPAGPNASIDVFAYRRTHVVVEVSGYFGR